MQLPKTFPKTADLYAYEKKNALGGTQRQLICLVIAASVGLAIWLTLVFLCKVNENLAFFILALIVLPCSAFGFYKPKGLKFEVYLKMRLKHEKNAFMTKIIPERTLNTDVRKRTKKHAEWLCDYRPASKRERKLRWQQLRKEIKEAWRLIRQGRLS